VAAAESWLKLVDDGKYDDSWDEAASFFRGSMPKAQWNTTVGGVRKPLGKLDSRKVKSVKSAKSLPGAPDGDYVVILFDASYAGKKTAIETVTPMKDAGTWRVSGYYIR
jgi:hypothetical protein